MERAWILTLIFWIIERLVEFFELQKAMAHRMPEDSPRRVILERNSAEYLVAQLSDRSRRQAMRGMAKMETVDESERDSVFAKDVMSKSFFEDQLKSDLTNREEMMKFLNEPFPAVSNPNDPKQEDFYHRNLDARVQHINYLAIVSEESLEVQQELVSAGFVHRVLDMIPLSKDKPSVMRTLIKALRVVATQELAVEQLLVSKLGFCRLIVNLLKQSNDVSLKIEASAIIALLTIIRDMVLALKEENVIPVLTSILSSPMTSSEQPVFNNGIVALVRIIAVSGDSIADDLKRAEAVNPLCNIVIKFQPDDRTQSPAVLNAVVTLLSVLSASPEVALQIVQRGCIPSLANILRYYVDSVSDNKPKHRDFRRITAVGTGQADSPTSSSSSSSSQAATTNAAPRSSHSTTAAAAAAAAAAPVAEDAENEIPIDENDDDVLEDDINPVYRGSDPEDILSLIRLLSRIPSALPPMIEYDVPKSLTSLLAIPTIPYSQKTQAVHTFTNFANDPASIEAVTTTDLPRILSPQTMDAGTSPEEITFQNHALSVFALFSSHEAFQRPVAHKYWLNSVVPRAPKTDLVAVQQAIGFIVLGLLRSDYYDHEVREIIHDSPAVTATIAHFVRADQVSGTKSVWSHVHSIL